MLLAKRLKSKKFLLIAALSILLLAGSGVAAKQVFFNNEKPVSTNTPETSSQEATGESDKSEPENTSPEQTKPAIVNREQQIQNQQQRGDDRKVAKPVITYAGQYGGQVEVGGYVPGVFEDGGICTAKFTNGSQTIAKSVKAVKNVSSIDCPVMIAKNEEFSPKGRWSVLIAYESVTTAGSSDSKTIEVK